MPFFLIWTVNNWEKLLKIFHHWPLTQQKKSFLNLNRCFISIVLYCTFLDMKERDWIFLIPPLKTNSKEYKERQLSCQLPLSQTHKSVRWTGYRLHFSSWTSGLCSCHMDPMWLGMSAQIWDWVKESRNSRSLRGTWDTPGDHLYLVPLSNLRI